MEKWRERLSNLNKFSRRVIKTGAIIGAALVTLALMLLYGGGDTDRANSFASAGVSVFCFGVMTGLVVDMRL